LTPPSTNSGSDTSDEPIHVIVISSVRPEPTSAGQIILYRHLVDQTGITLEVFGTEPKRSSVPYLIRRLASRLGRTRLHRYVEDFWVLWGGRWIDPELPKEIKNPGRTLVLTVAHGDGFMAARRYSSRYQLPIVAFFQDWWPDMAEVHQPIRSILEKRYRELYQTADLAICVCPGMENELGRNPRAHVIHDLPAESHKQETLVRPAEVPFKVLYFGNLTDYGPMLGEALVESLQHPEILLQVRGAVPAWPDERKIQMRENGRWLDFAPRRELDAWLASADAFLIPMVFDPSIRRRMETSFPSKLIEFAQFGKPLIVWGPEYCSALRWAREGDKAVCITDPDPAQVVRCLLEFQSNPSMIVAYSDKARKAAGTEFDPHEIQQRFRKILKGVVKPSRVSASAVDL